MLMFYLISFLKLTKNTQDVTYHVTQYQSIISELRKEIVRLKAKIDEQNGLPVSNIVRSESAQSFCMQIFFETNFLRKFSYELLSS